MEKTNLLPPEKAVKIAWARTGAFSESIHSQRYADLARIELNDIKSRSKNDEKEKEYVSSAIAVIEANLRNLDTIYKGRELNFKENEKLRSSHLDYVKQSIEFGTRAKDYLKSLPSITLGGASGVTLAQILGASNIQLWVFGLVSAAIGYSIYWMVIRNSRIDKLWLYVIQDYERGIYYKHYLDRVTLTLNSLYIEIDRFHENIFGEKYPKDTEVNEVIRELLKGIQPTYCKYVHSHLKRGIVEDRNGKKIVGRKFRKKVGEQWFACESGIEDIVKNCPYWKG